MKQNNIIIVALIAMLIGGCGRHSALSEDTTSDSISDESEIASILEKMPPPKTPFNNDIENSVIQASSQMLAIQAVDETNLNDHVRHITIFTLTGTDRGADSDGGVKLSLYDSERKLLAPITVLDSKWVDDYEKGVMNRFDIEISDSAEAFTISQIDQFKLRAISNDGWLNEGIIIVINYNQVIYNNFSFSDWIDGNGAYPSKTYAIDDHNNLAWLPNNNPKSKLSTSSEVDDVSIIITTSTTKYADSDENIYLKLSKNTDEMWLDDDSWDDFERGGNNMYPNLPFEGRIHDIDDLVLYKHGRDGIHVNAILLLINDVVVYTKMFEENMDGLWLDDSAVLERNLTKYNKMSNHPEWQAHIQ